MFIIIVTESIFYLIVYVDDIVVTSSLSYLVEDVISNLNK